MKKLLMGLLLLPALTACVNLGLGAESKGRSLVVYVMEDAGRPVAAASPAPRTLLVADTAAGAFYDTDTMAFSRQPGTRAYYKYARWSERPGKRFADLLLARLERERIFATIAQAGSSVRGDWVLNTEIVELYHDAVSPPGLARLELRAEVVDLKSRTLIARKTFIESPKTPSYDAAGAHQAFNAAVTRALDEMSDWLKTLSPQS